MYKIADHSSDLLTFFFLTLGMFPIFSCGEEKMLKIMAKIYKIYLKY
ncbi:hypothetical protein HMPREF9455_00555 [Dysgonomonas gadei ATCC BAA-286]|uniref:Uncharacterized protein n=1 Tax=Dysgonomonas gadei ATCC BAA-286 TaxID=742766 RepID=F5ITY8_9BACT|nr:hypothetical protein HMPREF9455_00555 [Dysgonomonas gadei ATCC BAA-286]